VTRAIEGCILVQCVNTSGETLDLLADSQALAPIVGIVGRLDFEGDVASQLETLRAAPGGSKLVGEAALDEHLPRAMVDEPQALAVHENVVAKISGLITEDEWNHCSSARL
jgi:hypothetical protein